MELTGNVQGLIDLVGGGSNVEFEQIRENGEKIAVITIDNVPTDIYAPESSEVEVSQVLTSGTKIATISVDGDDIDLYAPESSEVEVSQTLTSGTKIATISVDGDDIDLYAPEGGGGGGEPDYSTTEQNTGVKWIDGNDIYKITYISTSIANPSMNHYITYANNVKETIRCEGFIDATNNSYAKSRFLVGFGARTNNEFNVVLDYNETPGYINWFCYNMSVATKVVLTFYYTKTNS